MRLFLAVLFVLLWPVAALAQSTPTLVQQLTANLAYAEEYFEYHPNDPYYPPRISGLKKQLAAAIAAQNAGTPLAPLRKENGTVLPIHAPYVNGTASQKDGSKNISSGAVGATGSKKAGKSGKEGGKKKGN